MGDTDSQSVADAAKEHYAVMELPGLATMVRIMLMYYIDVHGFLELPEKDWEEALEKALQAPPESEQN